MYFRAQRPAEAGQCLADIVTVTIEKLIEPHLEEVFNRREQKSGNNGRNNPRQTT